MKHSIKTVAAMLMAGTMMISCVDTEVSPEVKAIRENQAALVKAQADWQAAHALYEAAVAEREQIKADSDSEDLRLKTAEVDADVKKQEAKLKAQELALAEATLALEIYIEQQGLTKAASILASYKTEAGALNDMLGDQIEAEAELAKQTAILNSPNADWEVVKPLIQSNLDKQKGLLVAQEAGLTTLKAVAADPSEKLAQINTLKSEIQSLHTDSVELAIAVDELDQTRDLAWGTYFTNFSVISDYESKQDQIASTTTTLAARIETAEEAGIDNKVQSDLLATYTTNYNEAKTSFDALKKDVADAQAAEDKANNELLVAQAAFELATKNEAAGNGTPAQTDAAEETRDEKQEAYDDAVAATTEAEDNLAFVEPTYTTAKNLLDGQKPVAEQAAEDLVDANNAVAFWSALKVNYESDLATMQADYDAAVAQRTTLFSAALEANDAVTAKDAELSAVESMMDVKQEMVTILEFYFDNINSEIDTMMADIEATKKVVQDLEEDLLDEEVDKAKQADCVAKLQAKLDKLTTEIAAQQAIVDGLKDLLDAAMAG